MKLITNGEQVECSDGATVSELLVEQKKNAGDGVS